MLVTLLLLATFDWEPRQSLERTAFQTADPYADRVNSRADVAIVYGFGNDLAGRVKGWKARGYKVQFMTGVAWGNYQDYLYGRWDGVNHEDEAQTQSDGQKIGHGGDVYYMSPGKNYGKYLCIGVQKALDAGVDAIHLEEPEFWARGGYGKGFQREWHTYYGQAWQAPDSSPDARWRASMLMYYLYRRALRQVFDYVKAYDVAHHAHVRCYVPTHSLLNYAHWRIVSPESSLARVNGCDGYIAQVWTGTARTPNVFRGVTRERTFETAFLEYGAMQNIVRATGRRVWYLADPVEDDPDHDWGDYKRNYEACLTASLLQPDVWRYEIMPWPNRVFEGKYPSASNPKLRVGIPDQYGTELQVLFSALKNMNQPHVSWDCGTRGIGFIVSDSLMFQRGGPSPSDADMSHIYGLALPFLERGMPIEPVQLENVTLPGYLRRYKTLLMTYEGMKPLTPDVHVALAAWVRGGGRLFFVDNDADPYDRVHEWWNSGSLTYKTPREDLFARLGIQNKEGVQPVGRGLVDWIRRSPTALAHDKFGDDVPANAVRDLAGLPYTERSAIILHRGPYVIAAGLEDSLLAPPTLHGRYLDLFDANLPVRIDPIVAAGEHQFLLELGRVQAKPTLLASAGSVIKVIASKNAWTGLIEGIAGIPAVVALRATRPPAVVMVQGVSTDNWTFDPTSKVLWLKLPGSSTPQRISITLAAH
ncbi:MAG: hypothetical protein ACYC96_12990 [Fimbriimonadaceae bacterium]